VQRVLLPTGHLQFAGFVRDSWVGVSVGGLLARPSTPPVVIERVTTGQIAPTLEAVQSAIDAVEEQVSAPQPDPAEQQATKLHEFDLLDREIRQAQAAILCGLTTRHKRWPRCGSSSRPSSSIWCSVRNNSIVQRRSC
jgi:hypothetical protein